MKSYPFLLCTKIWNGLQWSSSTYNLLVAFPKDQCPDRFHRTHCYSSTQSLYSPLNPILSPGCSWSVPTCDIWGLKLICFRSTDPGDRLCNIWHKSTPSRSAWARSKTTAEGQTTLWFRGKTLQSISHRAHCLHSSIVTAGRRMKLRKPSGLYGSLAETPRCQKRSGTFHSAS